MKKSKRLVAMTCALFFTLSFTACKGKVEKSISEAVVNFDSITFTDFTQKISSDDIYSTIEKFSATDNARVTGFDGEKNTAQYIKKQFQELGFEVTEQSFPITSYLCNSTELTIGEDGNEKIDSKSLQFTKGTPKEGVTAELVNVGMGSHTDFENKDVKGKVVLMKRGEDYFKTKVERAFKKGAVGAIFYDPANEDFITATLGQLSNMPAVSIRKPEAEKLVKQLGEGKSLKATLKVDSEFKEASSTNIIATMKSKKENSGKHIVVGAHYDGVDTPAANDNASGIATVLEAAKVLSKEDLDCDVKFIAFGAEEIGLVGSKHYVESLSLEEKDNIAAMLNLDMVGVGDTLMVHTMDEGVKSLPADLAVSCINKFSLKTERTEQPNSDHSSFQSVGIPAACFAYGVDKNYHTDKDTIDKIKKENLLNACNVLLNMCKEISKNPGGFSNNKS
ncbi:aminopeptidase YwaD [Clostridium punense]|uniref:Aminopeptidase YwaD n=1 Tax=Clostridium punense TaxID=1054297 RepID=A0ABS4K4K5_9CLOT|nr:M20/M25/M40 family metallo-hydrolase [Clostridium punense]MBP2022720.1 aminopeptidase YwaD [Clostridium punense]